MGFPPLNVSRENIFVVSVAGKYESSPEGKTTRASSLLEKGTSLSVDTKPGFVSLKW